MPDAARLVAAFSLALIAFIVSGQVMPLMEEGMDFGYFTPVNMVIGLLCGWVIMGKRAGRGITPAINTGLTAVIVMVLWALFVQGFYEMLRRAVRSRYDNPIDALSAAFRLSADYALTIMVPNILITLLVGALLAGLATEYAWRTWR
ncbi:TrgA family protein [Albibacillus kandeliae]|uniref:TrgA family protein n=1 Tax=Albibacillus kandeliae TaxID=2174228 RepID=UPI000D6905A4|nr:TrgA family protein [Albibacillus kandeliae]